MCIGDYVQVHGRVGKLKNAFAGTYKDRQLVFVKFPDEKYVSKEYLFEIIKITKENNPEYFL